MAKNDVVITLRIDDDGNIKQVGNKARKASKDVDKLGKSAARKVCHNNLQMLLKTFRKWHKECREV